MNIREEKNLPSPLLPYAGSFHIYCWEGAMADLAISQDEPSALLWLINNGVVNETSATFDNKSLLELCAERGKTRCAELLMGLGWPSVYVSREERARAEAALNELERTGNEDDPPSCNDKARSAADDLRVRDLEWQIEELKEEIEELKEDRAQQQWA
jgi:hypothetical protein